MEIVITSTSFNRLMAWLKRDMAAVKGIEKVLGVHFRNTSPEPEKIDLSVVALCRTCKGSARGEVSIAYNGKIDVIDWCGCGSIYVCRDVFGALKARQKRGMCVAVRPYTLTCEVIA